MSRLFLLAFGLFITFLSTSLFLPEAVVGQETPEEMEDEADEAEEVAEEDLDFDINDEYESIDEGDGTPIDFNEAIGLSEQYDITGDGTANYPINYTEDTDSFDDINDFGSNEDIALDDDIDEKEDEDLT